MLFPSDVLCNEAGQGVLRQRVKNAVNSLNRDWNFCSYATEGSRECKEVQIDITCDQYRGSNGANRARRQADDSHEQHMLAASDESDTSLMSEHLESTINHQASRQRQGRQQNGDTYTLEIAFPAVK